MEISYSAVLSTYFKVHLQIFLGILDIIILHVQCFACELNFTLYSKFHIKVFQINTPFFVNSFSVGKRSC